jgi:glycosyltransferase involved in cell wall biosynthesis
MPIKFTIIVPTRERASALRYCIENLIKQEYSNFEILISDNYSQDDTKDVVESFTDSRIRYVNSGKRISMSHNWEFALSHVNEGWVLFVGDDDGLLPFALRILDEVIEATGCEALTAASCTYWWPNHFALKPNGELTIPLPTREIYSIKDSSLMLDSLMCGRVAYRELPWLYNGGACSMNLLKRLRRSDGQFFCSFNPDIYSAIALALGSQTYASINIPIAINGASKFSNGTSNMLGQKSDPSSPASVMMREGNIPFYPSLEAGRSFQILVYEAYMQAAHLYGYPAYNLSEQLNTALIVAPASDLMQIMTECQVMAIRNGIRMPRSVSISLRRIIYIGFKFYGRLIQRPTITVSATQLGATNVNLAGDAANCVYGMLECIYKQSFVARIALRNFAFLLSLSRYSMRIFGKYQKSN